MKDLLLLSPGRTSGGGSAFADQLHAEISKQSERHVSSLGVPAQGRLSLPPGPPRINVFIGARVLKPRPGDISVFWPLNVAPLERHVDRLAHTSVRNMARQQALRLRLRESVGRADALVFGSHHARTLYLATYPAAERLPYTVIPGGAPSLTDPHRWTDHMAAPTVLAVSHLYPYKGMLELLEAFALVKRAHPASTLRIAGADRDPRYAAAVRERVADLGLSGAVEVRAANADELRVLYATSTIAVFPSTCENAGSFAVFDGLHSGIPTICSDRSSMPEMVGSACLMTNPYDAGRLAMAIDRMLSSATLRAEFATKADMWSAQAPTWPWRTARLLTYLEDLDT